MSEQPYDVSKLGKFIVSRADPEYTKITNHHYKWLIGRIATLEADNARLTAERDARVVLPEIPPEHQVAVTHSQRDAQHFGDEHAYGIEWFRYADHLNEWESLISTNGPTPAAALEALRDKLKGTA